MEKIRPPKSNGKLRARLLPVLFLAFILSALAFGFNANHLLATNPALRFQTVPSNANDILNQCRQLKLPAGPPKNFHDRTVSDRFEPGTPPTLINNATIWTGRVSGYEVVKGSVLIDKGIIQAIGDIEPAYLNGFPGLVTVDAGGAWVTPG